MERWRKDGRVEHVDHVERDEGDSRVEVEKWRKDGRVEHVDHAESLRGLRVLVTTYHYRFYR